MDVPAGPVARNLLPVRVNGSYPWVSEIPHAGEQLGPCTTTPEPALRNPCPEACVPWSLCTRTGEQPLLAATGEKLLPATKSQNSPK